MTKPTQPAWPAAGAFPFMPFPLPGSTAAQTPPTLATGMDLIKDFWGRMPGSGLPGFMVPTVDVEELDKRIGDLKAAERWVEVNLNMLRGTIQGLEVQRHTIAAIHSLTSASPPATTAAPTWPTPPASEPPTATEETTAAPAVPNDWLAHLQAQFAQVAQAAMTPAKDATHAGKAAKKGVARSRKATSPR